MSADKIAKLRTLGNVSITAAEIVDANEGVAASTCKCQTIGAWVIKKAAATGSCTAGELALSGIFVLADAVFFEADEILVPLETVIDGAWAAACSSVGIEALGADAEKYALKWCQEAGMCN